MKYWQWKRNFRRIVDEDGSVAYTIMAYGQKIKVSAEVYEAYSRMDRRERYLYEREEGVLLSLEQLIEDKLD